MDLALPIFLGVPQFAFRIANPWEGKMPYDFIVSPSLHAQRRDRLPAHEVKFVLTEERAKQVEQTLKPALLVDPHSLSENSGPGYSTTTVYCDTPEFDMYHRSAGYSRNKFRLRRYGHADTVYLERKTKYGTRVRKRRTGIPLAELPLTGDHPADPAWEGEWFRRRLIARQLRPVLTVMYDRTAYVGQYQGYPLRLTFDRSVRAISSSGWQVAPFEGGKSILSEWVICEFKFQGCLPPLFKAVVETQQLVPGSASKYRLGLEAVGLISTGKTPHV